jgi:hypothetical protein
MTSGVKNIKTKDCLIVILNNAPEGYEEHKSLAFHFKEVKFINSLKLPKLKYMDIVQLNTDLSFHLTYEPLRQFFNNFIDGFEKTMKTTDSGIEVVEKINKALRDLIKMAEKELELSLSDCMGLNGELLHLKTLLINSTDHNTILSGWNRPAPSNHDFDYEKEAIEIKTVSKDKTTVKITSAFQLEAPEGKSLFLKIYRIETIQQSTTDSLGELYNEIKSILNSDLLKEEFVTKCISDSIKYGGPRIVTLPYKFITIEEMTYRVDQALFPRINRLALPISISNISYSLDLSAIEEFRV